MKTGYRHVHTLRTSIYQYTKILIEIFLKFFLDIRDMIGNFTSKHFHEERQRFLQNIELGYLNLKFLWNIQMGKIFDGLKYIVKCIMNPVLSTYASQ